MLTRPRYCADEGGGGGGGDEGGKKPPEKPPEKSPEELKGELTRRREENDALKARLDKFDKAEAKRQKAADERTAAKKKEEGDYAGLEADLKGKIAAGDSEREGIQKRLDAFMMRDKAELDAILDGRDDADTIRVDLEGIPIERQLGLARKFLAADGETKPKGPTGETGAGGRGGEIEIPVVIRETAEKDAERKFPGDVEKQKTYKERFLASFRSVRTKRKDNPIGIGPKGGKA